ncbi:tetratricopeptide repeat protein [Sneathiella limimaris]|uniref:tetratricopeptide repeat protein n=1 Tax=Sneathiella limimaris TaxID=1964213 RepID=UPI00146E5F5F|nr:hypothetical protein [Sneathiella limimaris]
MRLILALVITFCALVSYAQAGHWGSATEDKLEASQPELFKDFRKARELIDNFDGIRKPLLVAKELLDKTIEQDINFAPAYVEYARLYYKGGHILGGVFKSQTRSMARAAIERAIEVEPDYEDAYVLLGYQLYQEGANEEALTVLDHAEELGSKSPWLHLNRMLVYQFTGQRDEAFKHLLKVIEKKPNNENAYSFALEKMARFYVNRENFSEADQWYERLLQLQPIAWNYSKIAYYQLMHKRDVDAAISYGEQALEKMDYYEARRILAAAYFVKWSQVTKKGRLEEAMSYFARGFELFPNLVKIIDVYQSEDAMKDTLARLRVYVRYAVSKSLQIMREEGVQIPG